MSKVEESLPSRRDFVKLGSTALVVATIGRAEHVGAAPAPGASPASVGFWAGVPKAARRFGSPAIPYLVPAESILAGDPSFFAAGARAFVRGVWRPEAARRRPASFALQVLYDADGQKVPFFAWSYALRSSDAPAFRSSRIAFNVPVDALSTLDLILSTPAGPQDIRFSVNSVPDSVKLRAGYYFVALPEGPDQQPIDWTRIRIREGSVPDRFDPQGPGVLSMSGFAGAEENVPFSYLVLRVDFGSWQLR